jgi:hypothetical protein
MDHFQKRTDKKEEVNYPLFSFPTYNKIKKLTLVKIKNTYGKHFLSGTYTRLIGLLVH